MYAKCDRNQRRQLWDELIGMANTLEPWMVGGDFNVILNSEEKQGGSTPRSGPMDDFGDMLMTCNLFDAGFEGTPYTWTNKRT